MDVRWWGSIKNAGLLDQKHHGNVINANLCEHILHTWRGWLSGWGVGGKVGGKVGRWIGGLCIAKVLIENSYL